MIHAQDAVDFLRLILPTADEIGSIVVLPCIVTRGNGTMISITVTHKGESAEGVITMHPNRQLDRDGMDFLVRAAARAIKELGRDIQRNRMQKASKNN